MITKRTQLAYFGQQINPNSPQAQGLVGMWALNDGGGTIARSCCGRLNGTLINGPTWGVGKFGVALSFNNPSGQYIAVANNSVLNPTAQITMSVFVKFTTTSVLGVLGKWGSDGTGDANQSYSIYINGGKIGTTFNATNATDNVLLTNGTYNDGKWHHVVATATASGTNNIKIYIDGVLENQSTSSGTLLKTTTDRLLIGATSIASGNYYFTGSLSDVRIYDRALSASEVQDLYANPNGIYIPRKIQFFVPETTVTLPRTRMLMGVGL